MKTLALIASLAVMTAFSAPSLAASSDQPAVSAGKLAQKHRTHTARASYQPQIACTVLGCGPIDHRCHPEAGYTIGGVPTGYDVIACR